MGLDQYAFVADDRTENGEWVKPLEIAQWRKHADLQGWMEQRWRARGLAQLPDDHPEAWAEFNCVDFELTAEDIVALEEAVELPHTEGFFFGRSTPEDKDTTRVFITRAKGCLAQGKLVYYSSWW